VLNERLRVSRFDYGSLSSIRFRALIEGKPGDLLVQSSSFLCTVSMSERFL
jgi:hypothetical protein